MDSPRVVLFSRPGCHLCDDARAVVVAEAGAAGADWAEVDIDAGPHGSPYQERDLRAEYGELVPVVEVDGVRQGYWRIEATRVRRALASGAARP